MKYRKIFLEYFSNFPIFTFADARMFLVHKGASEVYVRKLISLMVGNRELFRITKGCYTLNKNPEIIGYAFRPFYYGLGTALNHYNLSEQQANTTVITAKKVREGVRKVFDTNVVVRRIPQALYFGYEDVAGDSFHFYVSDVEKTLLDMLYFKYVVERYVYKTILSRINQKKISMYLKRYDDSIKTRYNALREDIQKQ